jgi:hypothetical protein
MEGCEQELILTNQSSQKILTLGKAFYPPDITKEPLKEAWNSVLVSVQSIYRCQAVNCQASVLLLVKFPVIGMTALLNDDVK